MTILAPDADLPDPADPPAAADTARAALALSGLTVVLPCLDEVANVAAAVDMATRAARRCAFLHQIVVVDDGSADGTATVAAGLARADPRIHLVVHSENRGYGAAMRSGIDAARMPWLLLTDADLQFDLTELEAFLPATREADLIMGRRIDRQDPWHRRLNAAVWNLIVRRVFLLPVA